jgi:hypothetical protein
MQRYTSSQEQPWRAEGVVYPLTGVFEKGDPFAEFNALEGKIVSMRVNTHRHQEWLKCVKQIGRETPSDVERHLMADNYATHKHGDVHKWLATHPRFQMHFARALCLATRGGRRSSARFTGPNRC